MHITFIHGILNKPPKDVLLKDWKHALENAAHPLDLGAEGITSEMVYWADVMYEAPLAEGAYEAVAGSILAEIDVAVPGLEALHVSPASGEAAWLSALSQRLGINHNTAGLEGVAPAPEPGSMARELEWVPLPGFVKDAFLKQFLRDVHHYLFNADFTPRPGETYQVQTEIRGRFVRALKRGAAKPGPHIVVSHSMGTVIAYDCLKRVADCPKVDALVTIGSPLGIDEVQDKLQPGWTRDNGFPSEKVRGAWLNFFAKGDVVSMLDEYIANDYRQNEVMKIEDIRQENDGLWKHDISKYLIGKEVSSGIARLLGV